MTSKEYVNRRRVHRRKTKSAVFVTFRPGFDFIGKVTDISTGGLAFEYTAFDQSEQTDTVEISIFTQPRDFNLSRAPCRVVYDRQIESCPSFKGFQVRRCGLEFRNLSSEQSMQLEWLLDAGTQRSPLES